MVCLLFSELKSYSPVPHGQAEQPGPVRGGHPGQTMSTSPGPVSSHASAQHQPGAPGQQASPVPQQHYPVYTTPYSYQSAAGIHLNKN